MTFFPSQPQTLTDSISKWLSRYDTSTNQPLPINHVQSSQQSINRSLRSQPLRELFLNGSMFKAVGRQAGQLIQPTWLGFGEKTKDARWSKSINQPTKRLSYIKVSKDFQLLWKLVTPLGKLDGCHGVVEWSHFGKSSYKFEARSAVGWLTILNQGLLTEERA
jgi:hypothetical protein